MGVQRFVKRPEQFEAQQFVGGSANGIEIVNWVTGNEGVALWLDELGPIVVEGEGTVFEGRPEGLRVMTISEGTKTAGVGDYVVKDGAKSFTVVQKLEFEAKFEVRP